MKFKEIKEALVRADREALDDWNEREKTAWMQGVPSIEEKLEFVEQRLLLVAGAVMAILTELIAQGE